MVDIFDTMPEGKQKIAYVIDKLMIDHYETEHLTETAVERVVIMTEMRNQIVQKNLPANVIDAVGMVIFEETVVSSFHQMKLVKRKEKMET